MKYLSSNHLLELYSRYWKIDLFDLTFAWRILIWDNWPENKANHVFRDVDYRVFFKRYCNRDIRKSAFVKFKVAALALFHEPKAIEIRVI